MTGKVFRIVSLGPWRIFWKTKQVHFMLVLSFFSVSISALLDQVLIGYFITGLLLTVPLISIAIGNRTKFILIENGVLTI